MDTIDDLFIKRKVYISTVGWISGILSGLIIYFSIFGMINIMIFNQNPMFKDFPINNHLDITHNFLNRFVVLLITYGLSMIFGIFFLISSIGLIKYKDWGRNIFIIESWILIILSVLTIIIYIIYSGNILTLMVKDSTTHMFEDMTGFMKTILALEITSYGILLVVVIRTLYHIIRRFNKDEYKRLFN